jgi:hypothetical protein
MERGQIEVSRRFFLGGALAVAGASSLPSRLLAAAPVIYGDGIHDDTAGLQAALAGRPFQVAKNGLVFRRGGTLFLSQGNFKLSDTLRITDRVRIVSVGNRYDFSSSPRQLQAAMKLEGGSYEFRNDTILAGRKADYCIWSDHQAVGSCKFSAEFS